MTWKHLENRNLFFFIEWLFYKLFEPVKIIWVMIYFIIVYDFTPFHLNKRSISVWHTVYPSMDGSITFNHARNRFTIIWSKEKNKICAYSYARKRSFQNDWIFRKNSFGALLWMINTMYEFYWIFRTDSFLSKKTWGGCHWLWNFCSIRGADIFKGLHLQWM